VPRFIWVSKIPYGIELPIASEGKSWSFTDTGSLSQLLPAFLKFPINSFFFVSTLITGLPAFAS
jgi:hypothetical protein